MKRESGSYFNIATGEAGTSAETAVPVSVTRTYWNYKGPQHSTDNPIPSYSTSSPETTPIFWNPNVQTSRITVTWEDKEGNLHSCEPRWYDLDTGEFRTCASGPTVTVTFRYTASLQGAISITDNVITNATTGITLSDIYTPPTISRIDFIDNTMAVRLNDMNSTVTIPVSDSYWGTTDLGEIADLIYDNLDDFNLGTVQVVNPVASPIH